ncbi:CrcB family protein [Blastococcus sp. BMG 814]|uniref:Fluoride-specific ion channel FluC n=1 Tax=Blastococcus carthaginiensis TaxID=3050034 RepID=A0ABT9IIS7_9ACTN|nr:CrcB family protein [Blastococcus carthaginiensis]MDP5185483.1 CrcB family protein [Blastococcus carthaginiensis]
MTPWLVVAGALVGAPLRLLAERIAVNRRGPGSVLGTLSVNVVGSALLGLLLGVAAVPAWVTALVGVGLCGTLTTFSTFGTEVVRLAERRRPGRAAAYVVATVLLGLAAAAAGFVLGRTI